MADDRSDEESPGGGDHDIASGIELSLDGAGEQRVVVSCRSRLLALVACPSAGLAAHLAGCARWASTWCGARRIGAGFWAGGSDGWVSCWSRSPPRAR